MCIIIDANVASKVFALSPSKDPRAVIDWVDFGGGKMVLGGRLKQEIFKVSLASRWIKERIRSGKIKWVSDTDIDSEEKRLKESATCNSNDHHIIALARCCTARILYSQDRNLHQDFTNPVLVNNPRGAVYTTARHCQHLLTKDRCP